MSYCPFCGRKMSGQEIFCPQCGKRLSQRSGVPEGAGNMPRRPEGAGSMPRRPEGANSTFRMGIVIFALSLAIVSAAIGIAVVGIKNRNRTQKTSEPKQSQIYKLKGDNYASGYVTGISGKLIKADDEPPFDYYTIQEEDTDYISYRESGDYGYQYIVENRWGLQLDEPIRIECGGQVTTVNEIGVSFIDSVEYPALKENGSYYCEGTIQNMALSTSTIAMRKDFQHDIFAPDLKDLKVQFYLIEDGHKYPSDAAPETASVSVLSSSYPSDLPPFSYPPVRSFSNIKPRLHVFRTLYDKSGYLVQSSRHLCLIVCYY